MTDRDSGRLHDFTHRAVGTQADLSRAVDEEFNNLYGKVKALEGRVEEATEGQGPVVLYTPGAPWLDQQDSWTGSGTWGASDGVFTRASGSDWVANSFIGYFAVDAGTNYYIHGNSTTKIKVTDGPAAGSATVTVTAKKPWLQQNYPDDDPGTDVILPQIKIRVQLPSGLSIAQNSVTLLMAVWDTTQSRGFTLTQFVQDSDVSLGYMDTLWKTSGIKINDVCYVAIVALGSSGGYSQTPYATTERSFIAGVGVATPELPVLYKKHRQPTHTKFYTRLCRPYDNTEPYTGYIVNCYTSLEIWESMKKWAGNGTWSAGPTFTANGDPKWDTDTLVGYTIKYLGTSYTITGNTSNTVTATSAPTTGSGRAVINTIASNTTPDDTNAIGWELVEERKLKGHIQKIKTKTTWNGNGTWVDNGGGSYTFTPTTAPSWGVNAYQNTHRLFFLDALHVAFNAVIASNTATACTLAVAGSPTWVAPSGFSTNASIEKKNDVPRTINFTIQHTAKEIPVVAIRLRDSFGQASAYYSSSNEDDDLGWVMGPNSLYYPGAASNPWSNAATDPGTGCWNADEDVTGTPGKEVSARIRLYFCNTAPEDQTSGTAPVANSGNSSCHIKVKKTLSPIRVFGPTEVVETPNSDTYIDFYFKQKFKHGLAYRVVRGVLRSANDEHVTEMDVSFLASGGLLSALKAPVVTLLECRPMRNIYTVTHGENITMANVNIGTDTFTCTSAHLWENGQRVIYYCPDGSTSIPELADGTEYYACNKAATTFQVAASLANALATPAVPIAISGTGNDGQYFFNAELKTVKPAKRKTYAAAPADTPETNPNKWTILPATDINEPNASGVNTCKAPSTEITINHNENKQIVIRARVLDTYGQKSDWSAYCSNEFSTVQKPSIYTFTTTPNTSPDDCCAYLVPTIWMGRGTLAGSTFTRTDGTSSGWPANVTGKYLLWKNGFYPLVSLTSSTLTVSGSPPTDSDKDHACVTTASTAIATLRTLKIAKAPQGSTTLPGVTGSKAHEYHVESLTPSASDSDNELAMYPFDGRHAQNATTKPEWFARLIDAYGQKSEWCIHNTNVPTGPVTIPDLILSTAYSAGAYTVTGHWGSVTPGANWLFSLFETYRTNDASEPAGDPPTTGWVDVLQDASIDSGSDSTGYAHTADTELDATRWFAGRIYGNGSVDNGDWMRKQYISGAGAIPIVISDPSYLVSWASAQLQFLVGLTWSWVGAFTGYIDVWMSTKKDAPLPALNASGVPTVGSWWKLINKATVTGATSYALNSQLWYTAWALTSTSDLNGSMFAVLSDGANYGGVGMCHIASANGLFADPYVQPRPGPMNIVGTSATVSMEWPTVTQADLVFNVWRYMAGAWYGHYEAPCPTPVSTFGWTLPTDWTMYSWAWGLLGTYPHPVRASVGYYHP